MHGALAVDTARKLATHHGERVTLGAREFSVLHLLLLNQERAVSRNEIGDSLYGWSDVIESNTTEVHVHNLHRRLGSDFIRTVAAPLSRHRVPEDGVADPWRDSGVNRAGVGSPAWHCEPGWLRS